VTVFSMSILGATRGSLDVETFALVSFELCDPLNRASQSSTVSRLRRRFQTRTSIDVQESCHKPSCPAPLAG
jgi:hypothetical protein